MIIRNVSWAPNIRTISEVSCDTGVMAADFTGINYIIKYCEIHSNRKVIWKGNDVWPSVVTHTRNLFSAFNPSKCIHSSDHTLRAVGGLVPCSRVSPQSWYWGGESARHSLPPPTIPAGPETRTRDLWVTSPALYPLGHDCPWPNG